MPRSLLLPISLFLSFSWAFAQNVPPAIVSGQIDDFVEAADNLFVKISYRDIATGSSTEVLAPVEIDGQFHVEVPLPHRQDVFLIYPDQLVTLLLSPGDSLHLRFAESDFRAEASVEPRIQLSGDAAAINRLALDFTQRLSEEVPFPPGQNPLKNMEPEEYKIWRLARMEQQNEVLHSFLREGAVTDSTFIDWARQRNRYETGERLLSYRILHPVLNGKQPYQVPFPDSFFNFLPQFPLENASATASMYYGDFLDVYFSCIRTEFYQDSIWRQKVRDKEINDLEVYFDTLKQITSDYPLGVILTQIMLQYLEWPETLDKVESVREDYLTMVTDPYLRNRFQQKYALVKGETEPMDLKDGVHLASYPDSLTDVLDKVIADHAGKVIYIDFWATWCGPCINEMPAYAPLREQVDTSQVAFVFMANSSPRNLWQERINEFDLKGDHYLLSGNQYQVMRDLFKIRGIPHYVIIDQEGRVVNPNAPRPKSHEGGMVNEALLQELRDLIKK